MNGVLIVNSFIMIAVVVLFSVPLAMYLLWLIKLSGRIPFSAVLGLAILTMVASVAGTLRSGYPIFDFLVGGVGCVPIMLVEVARSIPIWIREWRARKSMEK